ncbi:hypothetical protein BX070DRAFT_221821 [Coemansia spiralis]|nr:hypothetical protein BX070DRAFT_221821 [Coemansia spiralis]
MHARWRLSMSSPSSSPMCAPSMTVNEHRSVCDPIFISALCTRPRIFARPTPLASPANRVSTRRMMPQRSAQEWLITVACAPESTSAFTGVPLTCTSTYNMTTDANASGLCSSAASMLRMMFSCLIISSMRRCDSMSNGLALRFWISRCLSCSTRPCSCCSCVTSRANSVGSFCAARTISGRAWESCCISSALPRTLRRRASICGLSAEGLLALVCRAWDGAGGPWVLLEM